MPLSYHGFTPAAILIMVACLLIRQLWQYRKQQSVRRTTSLPFGKGRKEIL